MSIENYFCEKCLKFGVCDRVKTILKFDEEAKKPLGIDIKILKCNEYEAVKKE